MRTEHQAREWAEIDAAVFRTISSEDWRREVARARATPNGVRERLRVAAKTFKVGAERVPTEHTEKP